MLREIRKYFCHIIILVDAVVLLIFAIFIEYKSATVKFDPLKKYEITIPELLACLGGLVAAIFTYFLCRDEWKYFAKSEKGGEIDG